MTKKLKGPTILKIKLLPGDQVAMAVDEKQVDLIPSCAKLLLSTMIAFSLRNGSEPLEVMKECKAVLEEAWNENGVDWLIENVENDRKDRMGL